MDRAQSGRTGIGAATSRPPVASVLVVADSASQGERLSALLADRVLRLTVLHAQADVIAAARRESPLLIVLVDAASVMQGNPQLCTLIKRDEVVGDIPLLLIASLADIGHLDDIIDCGAEHFVALPCADEVLRHRMHEVLDACEAPAVSIAERVSTRDFERLRRARRDGRLEILGVLLDAYHGAQRAEQRAQALESQLLATQSACAQAEAADRDAGQTITQLREANSFLDAVVENIPDMVFVKDCRDLRFVRVNQAGERMLGYGRDEIIGRDAHAIFAAEEATMFTATDREALTDGGLVDIAEERVRRKDGAQRTLHTRKRVLRDADGEARYLLGLSKDITDRKRAGQALMDAKRALEETNAALARREEEIQSVVDFMADCVITIDQYGVIQAANKVVTQVFGWHISEVVGQNVSMLMPEPTRSHHDGFLNRYLNGGERGVIGKRRMVEGLRKDGERVMVELAVSEYQVHGKRFYTGIVRDVGERVRMLNELELARVEAERANRAKSEFLATMSHEIRTPMNGVIGMIEVLQQSSLKGYQVEMVDLIRVSAFSLLTIIDRILDFSKLEAGALEVEHAPMSISEVVETACGILDHLAVKKGVDLTFFVDPNIPPTVIGDALRVRQVLINLIGNAIKFSGERSSRGQVAVRAECVGRSGEEVEVELRVIDNGIGMDEATQARLFAPFSQADASTTRRFGGTGLGLAISRRLVDLMGGTIAVRSQFGGGSTFIVTLAFEPAPPMAPRPDPRSDVHNLHCLVIGSDEGMSADLIRYLAAADAQVARLTDIRHFTSLAALGFGDERGPLICVVDAGHRAVTPLQLLHALQTRLGVAVQLVVVVVERGKRRQPRQVADNLVVVDGNVLSGATLLRAVAAASGRASMVTEQAETGRSERALRAPTRDQALRDGRLILVAEDNEINQKVILRQLALLGVAADVAPNGCDALELWQQHDYALLLTDLHMPEMDGYDLTRAIRAREAGMVRRPIIALTANALKTEVEICRQVGMDDYLSKPATLDALRATLEKWLATVATPDDDGHATTGASPHAAIDLGALSALVGDDAAIVTALLREFQAGAGAQVADITNACKRADQVATVLTAHRLKSAARAIGAHVLAELCAEMERDGGTASATALLAFAARLTTAFERVDAFLTQHLAARDDSGRAMR